MAFSSFSERDALLENDSEHHVERSIPVGMEASTSSNHSSSSSSFASRITTKSFALGVAGMVLFAYGGHTVKQKMLGAEHGGDAPLTNESLVEIYDAITQSPAPGQRGSKKRSAVESGGEGFAEHRHH
ncbi:unnamed protein product [Bathycoccus prasinos]